MKKILRASALLMGALINAAFAAQTAQPGDEAKVKTPKQPPGPTHTSNAPNIVWILLDDVGFGASSAFGGLVETPNLEALASQGLRYTNFHTTAISSPTRAALLTGRNHHNVGMGLFPETANDQPGYNAHIPADKGTVAEVLHELGYSTYAVGKWHLAPVNESSADGPYTGWPTGKGFDHYFGFLFGETDQWAPQLVQDTHSVDIDPRGRHLNELLTDQAIRYVANSKSVHPDQPFFLYFAPGATHAPHQVSKEWIEHYKGRFDAGWDKYREEAFARQKALGVIPANAELPPRNPRVKAWDKLSKDEQRLFARYFETYAGFLSYTDAEIGRLVDFLKRTGQYDNTVFAIVIGDNGASKEGTDIGVQNGLGGSLAPREEISKDLTHIDDIGSDKSSANYPLGWAQAADVPYREWKQDANAEGGTRNPLILVYPKGISDKGGIREQYGHVIDLLPTTLSIAGLKAPQVLHGVKQAPFDGVSLAATVNDQALPSPHKVQYYEINGTRAIYSNGWKAGTLHTPGTPFDQDVWELYNLNDDPTELHNLADQYPAKLKELKALFDSEGRKNHVFPLKDTLFKDFVSRNTAFGNRKDITLLPGGDSIFSLAAPNISAGAFDLTANVEIAAQGAEGVLLANGGRFGGASFYVQGGRLFYAQTNGDSLTTIASDKPIGTGHLKLRAEFRTRSLNSAQVSLFVNDQPVGQGVVPLTLGLAYFSYDEPFDVGRDTHTPVTSAYTAPFGFSGKLDTVQIHYLK